MKRIQPTITILFLLASVLAVSLFSAGCGGSQARNGEEPVAMVEPAADAEPAAATQPDAAEERPRRVELEQQERNLTERMLELERRMDAVQQREEELTRREATIDDRRIEPVAAQPPATVAVVAPRPEPQPRTIFVTLPVETALAVEFLDGLSSETSVTGDPFLALVIDDVIRDGHVVVPAGAEVRGTVAAAVPQKKIGGQAQLALDFQQLTLPDGQRVDLMARLDEAGKKQTKKDAVTIGGSAAGGAILGRVLSKNDKTKGTAIGAVLGAAIGTAVASKNAGDPVVIEPGTTAELILEAPVQVAVLEQPEPAALARSR
jgi:hypothetical protein